MLTFFTVLGVSGDKATAGADDGEAISTHCSAIMTRQPDLATDLTWSGTFGAISSFLFCPWISDVNQAIHVSVSLQELVSQSLTRSGQYGTNCVDTICVGWCIQVLGGWILLTLAFFDRGSITEPE